MMMGCQWYQLDHAPRSRQMTTPVPHHSDFTGRMPFLLPNRQCQSTEGTLNWVFISNHSCSVLVMHCVWKQGATVLLSLTLQNVDQLPKFFNWQTLWWSSNKLILKHPVLLYHFTTLWKFCVQKSPCFRIELSKLPCSTQLCEIVAKIFIQ